MASDVLSLRHYCILVVSFMHIPLFGGGSPLSSHRAGGGILTVSWGKFPQTPLLRLEISHFCDFKPLHFQIFLTISIRYVCFYSDSMPFAFSLGMLPRHGFQGLFHALRIARTWSGLSRNDSIQNGEANFNDCPTEGELYSRTTQKASCKGRTVK